MRKGKKDIYQQWSKVSYQEGDNCIETNTLDLSIHMKS